ncbi:carboxyl transferase domain-containing protein [Nonomuraea sp. NPDC026600]|uniref:carboxyl transferase domain-containing protein n=1 Tax=Nonomuraea sp. NPDC026600 TaxID=3155363 RepID=UPI003405BA37
MTRALGARQLIDLVFDEDSFTSWDQPVRTTFAASGAYGAELAKARRRTGLEEAVHTGSGTIRGHKVAVVAGEFSFLGGSIGVATAECLVNAIERATAEKLPLFAAPASGGTRMQEGTIAFVQMVKITATISEHKAAGLPYLVYLRNPTTGGAFASWGSLGHLTVAEPGALVGFLGPRVYEGLYGRPFPSGVQVAENLVKCGLIDAVAEPEQIADIVVRVLTVLRGDGARVEPYPAPPQVSVDLPDTPAWESVLRSRMTGRPGVRQLLRYAATDVVSLNGTGQGEADPGLLVALARFGPARCVLLGQDRSMQNAEHALGPEALREARRGMRLAEDLNLPVLTVIDTPGAALSVAAEQGGLAGEIARCLSDMIMLRAPTLALLLGQGSGGAALALLPADRVVAAEHGWLAPLPPEGASIIMHRTKRRAPEIAQAQRVRSMDLHEDGIVDRVVPESPDAADAPEEFCRRVGGVIREELATLLRQEPAERLRRRRRRYRQLGASQLTMDVRASE